MVYVTGDCHGDISRFSKDNFLEQVNMTKNDYVIILGDFGLVWNCTEENSSETYWLNWLEEKPFTTLFIDGNHENFDRLDSYKVHQWHGGRVHFIRPSVIHLMRGEIFDIEDKNFFAFGGGSSHDIKDGILELGDNRINEWKKDWNKMFRINHLSWWKRELPNQYEMNNGLYNLQQNSNEVDYILTHCASSSSAILLSNGVYKPDILTNYLETIRQKVKYKAWLMGHYHVNETIVENEVVLYKEILRLI